MSIIDRLPDLHQSHCTSVEAHKEKEDVCRNSSDPASVRLRRTNQSRPCFKQKQSFESKDYFVSTPECPRINTLDSSSSSNYLQDENLPLDSTFSSSTNQSKGFKHEHKIKLQSVLSDNVPRNGKKLGVGPETDILTHPLVAKSRNKSTEAHQKNTQPRLKSKYQANHSLVVKVQRDDIQPLDHHTERKRHTDPLKHTTKSRIKSNHQNNEVQMKHSSLDRNRYGKIQPHDHTGKGEIRMNMDQAIYPILEKSTLDPSADDKYNLRMSVLNSKSDNKRLINGNEPVKEERLVSYANNIKENDIVMMKYPISSSYLRELYEYEKRVQDLELYELRSNEKKVQDDLRELYALHSNGKKVQDLRELYESRSNEKKVQDDNRELYKSRSNEKKVQDDLRDLYESHSNEKKVQDVQASLLDQQGTHEEEKRNCETNEQKGRELYESCSNEKKVQDVQASLLESHSVKRKCTNHSLIQKNSRDIKTEMTKMYEDCYSVFSLDSISDYPHIETVERRPSYPSLNKAKGIGSTLSNDKKLNKEICSETMKKQMHEDHLTQLKPTCKSRYDELQETKMSDTISLEESKKFCCHSQLKSNLKKKYDELQEIKMSALSLSEDLSYDTAFPGEVEEKRNATDNKRSISTKDYGVTDVFKKNNKYACEIIETKPNEEFDIVNVSRELSMENYTTVDRCAVNRSNMNMISEI